MSKQTPESAPSLVPIEQNGLKRETLDKVDLRAVSQESDKVLMAEVNDLRAQPVDARAQTVKAMDTLFVQSALLDGRDPALDGDRAKFLRDSAVGTDTRGMSNAEVVRDTEARILLPMIVRGGGAGPGMLPEITDKNPPTPINGSFFTQADLAKLAAGGTLEIKVGQSASTLPANMRGAHAGLDMNSQVDKVVALISRNEGKANQINWNDAGHGISVGLQQSNQERGNLPALLKRMHEINPEKFDAIFGRNARNMLSERYVRNADFRKNNELGRAMQAAVNEPDLQQAQLDLTRAQVMRSAEMARKMGINSTLGVALVADLCNQFGEGGARKYLRQARGRHSEEDKIRAVANSSRRGHSHRAARYDRIAKSGLVDSKETFEA